MPVNRRYPIKELLAACRRFPLEPRRRITFEYVLLRGVNDSRGGRAAACTHAEGHQMQDKPHPLQSLSRQRVSDGPRTRTVRRFQKILLDHHYTAPVRESRGRDISAACGQLRGRETAPAAQPV